MSLSKISLRPLRNSIVIVALRNPTYVHRTLPPEAPKKLPHPSETGFFSYARNWSRDKKYDLSRAPQRGNTPINFLVRRLGHAYELYPLLFLFSFSVVLISFTAYYSFSKGEIWLDKTTGRAAPGDWERIRNNYWNKETLLFDPERRSHQRLEMMEILEDEMLEAAKKRGTR